MNEKVIVNVTHIQMIGNKYLRNFYIQITCNVTNKTFKSPLIYGGKINSNTNLNPIFWSFQLFLKQKTLLFQMIAVNQKQQELQTLSQQTLQLDKQIQFEQNNSEQQDLYFYNNSKKIGLLTYYFQQKISLEYSQNRINKSQQTDLSRELYNLKSFTHLQKSEQFQQEGRFNCIYTPYQSLKNSRYQQGSNQNQASSQNRVNVMHNFTKHQLFNNLDQSSILQRHPYPEDDSFITSQQDVSRLISFPKKQKSTMQNQRPHIKQNCLKKWMKKLQKVQKIIQTQQQNKQIQPVIPQKYKKNNQQSNSIAFSIQNIKLKNQQDNNWNIKSFALIPLDDNLQVSKIDQGPQPYFQCFFKTTNNDNQGNNQFKIKKTVTYLPEDKHFEVKVSFLDTNDNSQITCEGILMKDKISEQNKISLLTQDDQIIGTLDYQAKKYQTVYIQSLPALDNLLEFRQENQMKQSYITNQYNEQKQKPNHRKSISYEAKLNNNYDPNTIQQVKKPKESQQYRKYSAQQFSKGQPQQIHSARKSQKAARNSKKSTINQQKKSNSSEIKGNNNSQHDFHNSSQDQSLSNTRKQEQINQPEEKQIKSLKSIFRQKKLNTPMSRRSSVRNQSEKKTQPSIVEVDLITTNKNKKATIQNSKYQDLSTLVNDSIISPPKSPLRNKNAKQTIKDYQQNLKTQKNNSYKSQSEDEQKASSFSINFKKKILRLNSQTTQQIISPKNSPQKERKDAFKLKPMSTKLQNFQEEPKQTFKGDTFKVYQRPTTIQYISNSQSQMINKSNFKRKPQMNDKYTEQEQQYEVRLPYELDNRFIIQFNTITIIQYQRPFEQLQTQKGKFLILKSDKQETIITQTLFNNDQLNLNWKNKQYQFKSSEIQLQLYQKTGKSTQSKNRFLGSLAIKFVDLMKSIKMNYHKAQLQYNGNKIATVIILYDIFIQRHSYQKPTRKRNNSQMLINDKINRLSRSLNRSDLGNKVTPFKTQQNNKMNNKNRKRANTFDVNTKKMFLPSIHNKNSNSPSRRYKNYEGGKNIKIGRAKRFSNLNVAQTIGQL